MGSLDQLCEEHGLSSVEDRRMAEQFHTIACFMRPDPNLLAQIDDKMEEILDLKKSGRERMHVIVDLMHFVCMEVLQQAEIDRKACENVNPT